MLKDLLTSACIPTLPIESEGFTICYDACGIGLGCILMQWGCVIAYVLRQVKDHERNYPYHDLELVEIVFTLKNLRHYLYGIYYEIFTDHHSVQHIMTQKEISFMYYIKIELLKNCDISILYYTSNANMVADTLSQTAVNMGSLTFISISQ